MSCQECEQLFEAWANAARLHVAAYQVLDRAAPEDQELANAAVNEAFRALRVAHTIYYQHQDEHLYGSRTLKMAG